MVTRRSRSAGDVARVVEPGHDIVPSSERRGCRGIPGCIAVNQGAASRTEPHFESNDAPARPADALEDVALCAARKKDTDGQNDQDGEDLQRCDGSVPGGVAAGYAKQGKSHK